MKHILDSGTQSGNAQGSSSAMKPACKFFGELCALTSVCQR
jgi:hypothetical protein